MTSIFAKKDNMTNHDPLIGEQLGDYRIIGMIGKGGMGRVYKGYDEKLDRYAAVKVFDAQGVLGDELEEYRQRFQREARAIARLSHPNIVGVYQFGQIGSLYYMAMVLIEGRDLREILKEYNRNRLYLPREAMMRILTDVAAALDYAHSEGVIHRDIKPSNIMVTADGHAVLTDFGLALNVPEGTIGSTFGTAQYIAPEQALNSAMAVAQSDLYSLGIVLYEILTGRVPFEEQSAMSVALRHLSDPPPALRGFNPDISYETEAVVLRVLDKEPDQRYETGQALVAALEKAMGITDEDVQTRPFAAPAEVLDKPGPAASDMLPPGAAEASRLPPLMALYDDSVWTEDASTVRPPLEAEAQATGKAKRLMLGGGLVAALVVVGLILLAGSRNPAQENDAPTVVLTDTSAVEAASAIPTEVEAALIPTEIPKASVTPVPASPVPVLAAEGQIELIYDTGTLLLLNRSDETLDLSGINFVQGLEAGNALDFPVSRWEGGTAPTHALPPGDCFQVLTTQVSVSEPPESCGIRHKWDQASFPRWFWISETPDATFEVRRDDQVLAVCEIDAGECRFDLSQ